MEESDLGSWLDSEGGGEVNRLCILSESFRARLLIGEVHELGETRLRRLPLVEALGVE